MPGGGRAEAGRQAPRSLPKWTRKAEPRRQHDEVHEQDARDGEQDSQRGQHVHEALVGVEAGRDELPHLVEDPRPADHHGRDRARPGHHAMNVSRRRRLQRREAGLLPSTPAAPAGHQVEQAVAVDQRHQDPAPARPAPPQHPAALVEVLPQAHGGFAVLSRSMTLPSTAAPSCHPAPGQGGGYTTRRPATRRLPRSAAKPRSNPSTTLRSNAPHPAHSTTEAGGPDGGAPGASRVRSCKVWTPSKA